MTGVPPNVEGKAESPRRGQKSQADAHAKEQKKSEAQYSDHSFEESEDNSKG